MKIIALMALAAASTLLCACTASETRTTTQEQNRRTFAQVLTDPENIKLSAMGCSYEQVQKQLHGVPQSAAYSELQDTWGTRSLEDLMKLHGLPAGSTPHDLYRAVRLELERDGTCEKRIRV